MTPSTPHVFVLTGAGVSQGSGLATFRDADGVWARVRIEDVATPDAFARDPARVHAFYNARRAQLLDPAVQPNAAHHALARLARDWPGGVTLVTQNVDDLHERAGHPDVIHMHGELRRVRCLACAAVRAWDGPLSRADRCPGCGGGLRPDIVWFGEMPMHMGRIEASLDRCTLFASVGTSGQVYPAAGFVAAVRGRARTVELNLEPSAGAALFDEAHHGPAARIVPAWVDGLLAGR